MFHWFAASPVWMLVSRDVLTAFQFFSDESFDWKQHGNKSTFSFQIWKRFQTKLANHKSRSCAAKKEGKGFLANPRWDSRPGSRSKIQTILAPVGVLAAVQCWVFKAVSVFWKKSRCFSCFQQKYTWVFPKIGVGPPNHPFVHRVFHYKPSILGGFPPIFGNTHKLTGQEITN